jgi:hypothetical protein
MAAMDYPVYSFQYMGIIFVSCILIDIDFQGNIIRMEEDFLKVGVYSGYTLERLKVKDENKAPYYCSFSDNTIFDIGM